MPAGILLSDARIGKWQLKTLRHENAVATLSISVVGIIGNSVPTSGRGKQALVDWKRRVVADTKRARGHDPLNPLHHYAVSIGFSFYPPAHGHQPLDIENFVKPTIDALAAGLFCPADQDPSCIVRYNYDDSNFTIMLLQRLHDASQETDEGAALFVSASAEAIEQ